MKLKQIFVIAIIAMFLLVPFASAKQEVADNAKQDKKIDEKVTDKTKESAKEITSKDKDIKGKVTVTDSDTEKYAVEKKSKTEISISKAESKGEHTKSKVTFAKEDLHKIDVDGDQLYGVLHIADDGSTSHGIYTESQLTSGTDMVFSENIVNGFSGYWEGVYTGVTSGTTINTPDVTGNYYMSYTVNGTIPASTEISDYYKSTYPQSSQMISCMPMNNATEVVSGNTMTGYNVTYADGSATFNKSKAVSYIDVGNLNYTGNLTVATWIKPLANASIPSGIIGDLNLGSTGWSIGIYLGKYIGYVTSTSYYLYTASSTAQIGAKTHVVYKITKLNTTHSKIESYVNGALSTTGTKNTVLGDGMRATYVGNDRYYGGGSIVMDEYQIYNAALSESSIRTLFSGYTGISVRSYPSSNFTNYNITAGNEKIIKTGTTCEYLKYIDTTSGTHTVTVRVYFTEDITKTTETKGAIYQNVSIIHTKQNATASVGSIAWELDPLYSGTPVLTSNNTNATVSRNDTHAIISTGLVKQGQSFSYAVSVPDNHNHGFHLGDLMRWVGTGWDFVSTAPEDWDNYIGDEIEVTVS